MTTAATSAATIERDISCFECHYNIRGLPADTACPECGLPVGNTLLAIVDREAAQRSVAEIDAPLLRGVRDGTILILLGLVLWIGLLFVPASFYRLRTPERQFLLGVACSAWTCTCFGFHKLAARSSTAIIRAADPMMRRLLRATALLLAILPAMVTICGDYRHDLYITSRFWREVIFLVSVCALTVIGPLAFLRIHRLMRLLGMNHSAALAAFVATFWSLNGFICYFSVSRRYYDEFNSLEFLARTPLPPWGCNQFWELMAFRRYYSGDWQTMLIAILPLMSIGLTVALCVATRRRLAAIK
jgi:hypothetical protein